MEVEHTNEAKMRVHVGRLVEHGAAPFRHVRQNSMSYYLVLQTKFGLQPLWNPALHAALHRSRAQRGDQVTIIDRGPVAAKPKTAESTTSARARHNTGIPQNRWLILPAAEQLRAVSLGPQRTGTLLNEVSRRIADRSISVAEDRERFVTMVRTIVQNVRAQEPPVSRTQAELGVSSAKTYVAQTLAVRIRQLHQDSVAPTFDAAHLSDIHATLFRGLRVDAGHFRSRNTELALAKLSQTLDRASPGSAKESSIFSGARLFREILTLQPFDYGNLPTSMVYVEQHAKRNGFELNLFGADRQALYSSLRDAVFRNDMTALRRVLRENLRPVLSADAADQVVRSHAPSAHQNAAVPAANRRPVGSLPVSDRRDADRSSCIRRAASFRGQPAASNARHMTNGVAYDR